MPRGVGHNREQPKSLGRAVKNFIRSLRAWLVPIIIAIILAIGATVCSIFGPKILGQMTNSAVEDYQTAIINNGGQLPDPEQLADAIRWDNIGRLAIILIVLYIASVVLNYVQ